MQNLLTDLKAVCADDCKLTVVVEAADSALDSLVAAKAEIASVISRLDDVMQVAVRHAMSLTGADGAAIQTRQGHKMVFKACTGIAAGGEGFSVPVKNTLVGKCIDTGLPQYCPDRRLEPGINQEAADNFGFLSILLVPLTFGAEFVGVVLVMSKRVDGFDKNDRSQLILISEMIASAMSYDAAADARERLIDAQKKSLQDLLDSQHLYLTSINAIEEGYMVVGRDGLVLNCNSSAERIVELGANDLIGKSLVSSSYSFVDEDGGELDIADHPVWHALKTGSTQSVVIGLKRNGRQTVWLSVSACPLYHVDEDEPYAAVQIFHDVTLDRAAAIELKKSEERLREAQKTAGIGSWELEVESLNYWLSEEMYRIYELDPTTAKPSAAFLRSFVHPEDLAIRDKSVDAAVRLGEPFDFDFRLVLAGGRIKWCHAVAKPTFSSKGEVVKIVGTLMDITARKLIEQQLQDNAEALAQQKEELELANSLINRANEFLRTLVVEDGMTGLKNHRAFQEQLADEVMRAKRHKNSLSLLMLDVDHFKQFNDTFGHPEGDVILQKVAELITANKRESDMAARYGGEEFALILPHTASDGAFVIAERIRCAVESVQWPKSNVTVSIGICSLSAEIESARDLITIADKALYESKEHGRNRISIFGS